MRSPSQVLNNLVDNSKKQGYKFQRLYRNLYNIEFYYEAYQNIYAKEGNMTEGTDGKTIDGMSTVRIEKLIEQIKNESYKPNPARRTYIPKKNGKLRPLGIPSIDDKLVQEVVRRILEAIFEVNFSPKSHGFRPNKSCQTALNQIEGTFTACKWFIEGDIKGFFDNIDHQTLINILKRRIDDDKFLRLIWKFLKAGYLEEWNFHKTISGTPQGGIISPILSNIYLNELDEYMEKYKENFDKGKNRSRNTEYRTLCQRAERFKAKHKLNWENYTKAQKTEIANEYKRLVAESKTVQRTNPMDNGYKRLQYTRYADDFIIGVIGNKQDAVKIKEDITKFLQNELKLELSQEKTLITNTADKARFLSYDITVERSELTKRDSNGILKRSKLHRVKLLMPTDVWRNKLLKIGALKIHSNGKWEPIHRRQFVNNDDLEIFSIYNAEIRGIYEYYKQAENVNNLHKYLYVMKFSLLKTLANKYKTSVRDISNRYKVDGKLAVKYETKKGEKIRFFYDEGFKRFKVPSTNAKVDYKENIMMYSSTTSLIDRLKAKKCEWCHKKDVDIEIHHVKRLKDTKGKSNVERMMIARNRKTLALCVECHDKLHAGKLN